MNHAHSRKLFAEFIGTAFLLATVVGSGIMAERLAGGNTAIEAGESAVGGLIGLLEIAQDEKIKKQLALNSDSVILLFGTEGATDPDIYNAITKEI